MGATEREEAGRTPVRVTRSGTKALADSRSAPNGAVARPPPTRQTARNARLNFLYAYADLAPVHARRGRNGAPCVHAQWIHGLSIVERSATKWRASDRACFTGYRDVVQCTSELYVPCIGKYVGWRSLIDPLSGAIFDPATIFWFSERNSALFLVACAAWVVSHGIPSHYVAWRLNAARKPHSNDVGTFAGKVGAC